MSIISIRFNAPVILHTPVAPVPTFDVPAPTPSSICNMDVKNSQTLKQKTKTQRKKKSLN